MIRTIIESLEGVKMHLCYLLHCEDQHRCIKNDGLGMENSH